MGPSASSVPHRTGWYPGAASALLLTAAVGLGACTAPAPAPSSSGSSASPATGSNASASAGGENPAMESPAPDLAGGIPQIVENLAPSVVTIFTDGGLGSGVVDSEDGLILTNEHVVSGRTTQSLDVKVELIDRPASNTTR